MNVKETVCGLKRVLLGNIMGIFVSGISLAAQVQSIEVLPLFKVVERCDSELGFLIRPQELLAISTITWNEEGMTITLKEKMAICSIGNGTSKWMALPSVTPIHVMGGGFRSVESISESFFQDLEGFLVSNRSLVLSSSDLVWIEKESTLTKEKCDQLEITVTTKTIVESDDAVDCFYMSRNIFLPQFDVDYSEMTLVNTKVKSRDFNTEDFEDMYGMCSEHMPKKITRRKELISFFENLNGPAGDGYSGY